MLNLKIDSTTECQSKFLKLTFADHVACVVALPGSGPLQQTKDCLHSNKQLNYSEQVT